MRASLAVALAVTGAGTVMNLVFWLNDLNPELSLFAAGFLGGLFTLNLMSWIRP